MKKLLFLFFLFTLLISSVVYSDDLCEVYFFYSPSCPYCAAEKPFLDQLEQANPELKIHKLIASENWELYEQISKDYESAAVGVPRTFVNGKVFVGFDESKGELKYSQGYLAYIGYKNQIENSIMECLGNLENINYTGINETGTCDIKEQSGVLMVPVLLIVLYGIFFFIFKNKIEKKYMTTILMGVLIISFFYVSQHISKEAIISFAEQLSFPGFTFIIALLDGFNPCAFAVLAVLLSLLTYSKSRRKMAMIGAIFILTSGIMYFLFIMILMVLRAELLGAYKEPIRIIVGLIAITAGSINLKDFFFFKKGISLTISSDNMSKLTKKMRNIVEQVKDATTKKAMIFAILGTIVLAALVNVIELGCTLILPIEYIEVLLTNYGTQINSTHYIYTGFYSLVYIIPLFAILGVFLYSQKSMRVQESQGKILKLISGLVMIGLGLILILIPELLAFA